MAPDQAPAAEDADGFSGAGGLDHLAFPEAAGAYGGVGGVSGQGEMGLEQVVAILAKGFFGRIAVKGAGALVPEADVIVEEIERIANDPALSTVGEDNRHPRSIGVISLIGAEQATYVQKKLMDRIGEAAMIRHRIICGDSASFQGDERDIIFLSMIADRNKKQAQTATQYEQRFNVALSRARDRMVLVRSVSKFPPSMWSVPFGMDEFESQSQLRNPPTDAVTVVDW